MTTQLKNIIHVTNTQGGLLLPEDQRQEPEPSSVVMVGGIYGVAWQRHFLDGMWHSNGHTSETKTWAKMLTQRNLVLVYDAPKRDH